MKFKELRKYISKIDRLHILMEETLEYKNFKFISEVPESYDDLYVFGIGMRESEFKASEAIDAALNEGIDPKADPNKIVFAHCIEIMLSQTERDLDS